ncbi:MAG: glycolate oxidase subunit GlcF, partial [Betaproteobacteria bacterium]|nr:glycolate oxidase subunit GlcF [Betaproteobacteria bacterium]
DSPRGRIYLIKQVLEGGEVSAKTQTHLDRCLTCRACETTCPSGVQYGRLLDIGREQVEQRVPRTNMEKLKRAFLKRVLPQTGLFALGLTMGRMAKSLLPAALAEKIPAPGSAPRAWPQSRHRRTMLVLAGCVQPAMAPNINAAAATILDKLGISLITAPTAGCCGAIAHHLNDPQQSHAHIKRNIDAWWPYLEAGAEAIVMTASGCGTQVADYGHLLRHDPAYADKAARVSACCRDVSQVIAQKREALMALLAASPPTARTKLAFHAPCSLQHGLKIRGVVEDLLQAAGFDLTRVPDGHLCCGSAGTYSLLQPALSKQLQANKVKALESGAPALIATANIGCLAHLESGLNNSSKTPIRHWVEILEMRLR